MKSVLSFLGLFVVFTGVVSATNFMVEVRKTQATTTSESPYVNTYLLNSESHNGPVTSLRDTLNQESTITLQLIANNKNSGQFWDTSAHFVTTFSNQTALDELQAVFGTFPQETMVSKVTSHGQDQAQHTVKLNGFEQGTSITLYMFLSSLNTNPTSHPTVSGGNGTFQYATDTGSGFSQEVQFSEVNHLTLVKWQGEVTKTEISFALGGNKTGISALFLHVVPEPASTALCLCGLAGLTIRRRR